MNLTTKITAILLLMVMGGFMAVAFFPNQTPSTFHQTAHADCFGVDCGPVQHLLHAYTLMEEPSLKNQNADEKIDPSLKKSQSYLVYAPDTPPPKISQ